MMDPKHAEGLESIVRRNLPYLDEGAPLDPGTSLAAYGLDSMATVQLLLDVEEHIGATLPDEWLVPETFATYESLLRVIESLLRDGAEPPTIGD